MNHLNQRKSPSALLVSKEIETKFWSSSFFQKSRKVPEVADLSIVCGWGVRLSLKFVKFVKKACVFSELMRSCVEGMRRLSGNLIFCHLAFLNYYAFFQRGDRLHHPGGEDTIWGTYFVSLLAKNHIEIFCLKRLTTLVLFFSTYIIERKMCRIWLQYIPFRQ